MSGAVIRETKTAASGGKSSSKSSAAGKNAGKGSGNDIGIVGGVVFVAVLILMSALAGVDFKPKPRLYLAGEIAENDVRADKDFLVEDTASTMRKREQVAAAQPPVFDYDDNAFRKVETHVYSVFETLNTTEKASLDDLRWQIAEEMDSEIDASVFTRWTWEDYQNLVLGRVLPWLEKSLESGVMAVVGDLDMANGIIVRGRIGQSPQDETVRLSAEGISDIKTLRSDLDAMLKQELHKPLIVRKAVDSLIGPMLTPSLIYNALETRKRRIDMMRAVQPVYYHVQEGEIIVRRGEVVDVDSQIKLQTLFAGSEEYFLFTRALGIFIIGILAVGGLILSSLVGSGKTPGTRDLLFLAVMLLLFGGLGKFLDISRVPLAESLGSAHAGMAAFALPIAGAGGLAALFFPYSVCFFASLLLAFTSAEMLDTGSPMLVFYFLTSMLYAYLIKQASTRGLLLKSVFPLTGVMLTAWLGVSFMEFDSPVTAGPGALYVIGGALFSLFAVLAVGPVVEYLFGYTSRFKLLELMNLEQPLLQELMVKAPGTYHHSLILSNLVEAGARAIGADPLLSKVAALYHDIGKLKNPLYFIENQIGRENKHDKLAPSMSALILISHVKKGVELAEEHKLGTEITEIIRQHHGTGVISYFHQKAEEQAGEPVDKEDYCYPGPKPQTKEAGLLLLADAVEASARTLVDPTPARIKGHIQKIFKQKFADGQLDESDLTFKDLHKLSVVFNRILNGIFHTRIEYPDAAKNQKESAEKKEPGKKEARDVPGNVVRLAKAADNRQARNSRRGNGG